MADAARAATVRFDLDQGLVLTRRRDAPIDIREPFAMPTGTVIVVTAIAVVFTIFALVLAWADLRTTRPPRNATARTSA
jgi:hypothetical protein